MSLAATGALVAAAASSRGGVAAFNAITLEHAEAIVAGAQRTGRPVIVQISQNAVRFHADSARPLAAACRALAERAVVEVALHLDHVDDRSVLEQAVDAGFSSVMFDAGSRPYTENVAATAEAAGWAHAQGLWVEAELGYVGGKPDQPAGAHAAGVRTDPDEARDYVLATGVDALAVAVGSSHAMTSRTARLDTDLVASLASAVPVPLVLHGSSGVPDDELKRAIAAGLVKINIGTALNVAMTAAVRRVLEHPTVVDPRAYLSAGREAMVDVVAAMLTTIGSSRL